MTPPGSNSYNLDSIHLTNIYHLAVWGAGRQPRGCESAILHGLRSAQSSAGMLGQSSNAVSALVPFWAQLTFCFLLWLYDPEQGGSYMCWAESSIFLIYQLEIVTVPLIRHTTQSSADANDGHDALVFRTWAPCSSYILCLFQNFTPAPGSFSVFSLPSFPNTGKKGCPLV